MMRILHRTVLASAAAVALIVSGCVKGDDVVAQDAQGGWSLVRDGHATLYFHALAFADRDHGWAVGDSGVIIRTSDGGATWTPQASGTTEPLVCVHFTSAQKGWIGGGNNTIGSTTNGGLSWTWQHPAGKPKRVFMAMSFVNDSLGWIVENNSGILHTTDGGVTWTPQVSGSTWALTSVHFLDANEGWAVSTNVEVLHTTDGGNTWSLKKLNTLDYGSGVVPIFTSLFFHSRTTGWIATDVLASDIANPAASVVVSTDGGTTWTSRITPEHHGINALFFVDERTGWAACNGGILSSTNGGATWATDIVSETAAPFVDLYFIDGSHGWALSAHGGIYTFH